MVGRLPVDTHTHTTFHTQPEVSATHAIMESRGNERTTVVIDTFHHHHLCEGV